MIAPVDFLFDLFSRAEDGGGGRSGEDDIGSEFLSCFLLNLRKKNKYILNTVKTLSKITSRPLSQKNA